MKTNCTITIPTFGGIFQPETVVKTNSSVLKKLTLALLVVLIGITTINTVKAEGSGEWGTATNRKSWLWVPDNSSSGNTGYGTRGFMMLPTGTSSYNAAHRFLVYAKNGETVFFGFHRPSGTGNVTVSWYYDGTTTGFFPTGTSGTGRQSIFSQSYALNGTSDATGRPHDGASALAGPSQVTGSGYTGYSFVNNTGADRAFWVEMSVYGFNIDFWDVTVASGSAGSYSEKTGRVYCKYWSAYNDLPTTSGSPNSGSFHDTFGFYIPIDNPTTPASDFFVKSINFGGSNGGYVVFFANDDGPRNTLAFNENRKSISGTSSNAQYPLFVGNPDASLWPDSPVPTVSIVSINKSRKTPPAAGGQATVTVYVSDPAVVEILIDLNNNGVKDGNDVVLSNTFTTTGNHDVYWNGNNSAGSPVANGTTITLITTGVFYPAHFPVYDMEQCLGITVKNIRPGSVSNDYIFWDDSGPGIVYPSTSQSVQTNTTGVVSPNHIWYATGDNGFSNNNTINTWIASKTGTYSETVLFNYNLQTDLGVTKTVSPSNPSVGGQVIFTVGVRNYGPENGTSVTVSDPLPTGYAYFSDNGSGSYIPGTGVWSIGALANGATRTLTITATVSASGTYTNTATVWGAEEDPNTSNNTATAAIGCAAPATPTISASGPTTFCEGGSVILTSSAATSYLWSTGATTQSITVSTSGSYTVQVKNANGCQSAASAATTVTVNPLPATPTISASGPTTFCEGGSVILTSSAATSYLWSTGATTQSITVSTSGSYTVQVKNANGCQSAASAATTVTVNPLPATPTISASGPTTFCEGGSVILTSSAATSYLWSNSATTQSITVSTSGSYTVQVKNANGCQSAASAATTVTVNPLPATPTISASGPTTFCEGGSVILTSSAATSYLWSNSATTQSITVSTSGSYTVQVKNANGCQSAASAATTVTVNPLPATPTISASGPTTFCEGGSVILTSSAATSYLWSNSATTQSITVSTSGSYTVQVKNANGCQSAASAATTVTVNPLPATPTISASGPTTFCEGGSVILTSSAATSYLWSNSATTQSITVSTSGSYTVQVKNANGCQSAASAATTVTVNPLPATPTISASGPTTFCEGGSVILTSSAATSYLWSTGATTQSITVSTSGSYTVQVKNANGCQSAASAATTVTVNPLPATPTISASGPTTFCEGGSVILTSSAATSYLWSNSATTQSITVSTSGSYTVQVKNANGCQSAASAATTVTVNPLPATPTISASGPTTFCEGGSVILTSSAATSYLWSNSATTQSITVSTSGSYTVQVKNANGCQSAASAATTVTVNPLPATPTISASGPTTFCEGGSVILTSSAATSYLWSTGATTQSITVSTSGSYTVQVKNANGCQSAASAATTVTVNPLPATPTISASGPTTFCEGGSVILTSSAATSYLWSNSATTQSITVSTSGSYTVQVKNANGCQSAASAATTVTVNAIPSAPTASNGGAVCVGSTLYLYASEVTGATYAWTGPNGFSSALRNPTISNATTSASGTYSVTVTVNSCTSAAAITNAMVNALPTITTTGTIAAVTYSASAQSTTLAYSATTNSPTSYSIDWSAAANSAGLLDQDNTAFLFASGGGTLTGITVTARTAAGGPYAGTMTIRNANGCTNTLVVNMTINAKPILITADADQTKVYGQANPTPYTYTHSALEGTTDDVTGLMGRAAGEDAGSYAFNLGTLTAGSNYSLSIAATPEFTITPKGVLITADADQTKVYGQANPTPYTYTHSALEGTTDDVTGLMGRAVGENVGTYAFNLGTLTAGSNYSLSIAATPEFTITPKGVLITADADQTKVYGQANPTPYTYTHSALEGTTDDVTGLMGRAAGEDAGSYAFNLGTLTAGSNYSLSIAATPEFTITPKGVLITADADQTKVYGQANPTPYTYTHSALEGTTDDVTGLMGRAVGENVGTYVFNLGTLTAGSNYSLSIAATPEFTITPKGVLITADADQTKVYGQANPTPYTYTHSALEGTTDDVTGLMGRAAGEDAGSYAFNLGTLTAGSNYSLSIAATPEFTITPKGVLITADADQTKVYGQANPTPYTYTHSALEGTTDDVTGLMGRAVGENVGTYAFNLGTLTAGSNYSLSIAATPEFTITPKGVLITADADQTKVYGQANPTPYTYTHSALEGTTDDVTGLMGRAAGEDAGSYAFNLGTLTAGPNYSLSVAASPEFSITPKDLTITADNKSKCYDGEVFPYANYTVSYSGFITGEDETDLGGTLGFTGPAIAATSPENYTIIPGGLTSVNYNITFLNGTLTIHPALPVSVSIEASGNLGCEGNQITFTAAPVNGGTEPSYQWKVNGTDAGTNSPTYTYVPANNDAVTCVLTSNAAPCATGNPATSNTIIMNFSRYLVPTIVIAANSNPACIGNPVTFTSAITNGGTSPAYQWKKNGNNVGANSPVWNASNLVNGDVITCDLTSSSPCTVTPTVTSNPVTITIVNRVTPTIVIAASSNPACNGSTVTFTSVITNGGEDPAYQWKKNGNNVGNNNPVYTDSGLANGDVITCDLTSSLSCASVSMIASNQVIMTVNPMLPVSVSLAPSANPVCEGSVAILTATPVNGGSAPVYAWHKNSLLVQGATGPAYAYAPVNGDQVYVTLTSSEACAVGNPATSTSVVTFTVKPVLPVTASIAVSKNPVCSGIPVTFTATTTNGGTNPVYQWYKGTTPVGTNNAIFTYLPANHDAITCVVTSSELCTSGSPATSTPVVMTVKQSVAPAVSIVVSQNGVCEGTPVTFTATGVNGGWPTFQWFKNKVSVDTGQTYTYIPHNGDVVYGTMTSTEQCLLFNPAISDSIFMAVNPLPIPVIAGASTVFAGTTEVVYTTQFGKSNYDWHISAGGTITSGGSSTDALVAVTWNTLGTQWISVNYTNPATGCRAATATVFMVTVIPAPFIKVTSPNGDEAWMQGTTHNITWNDNISENVKIDLYQHGEFLKEIVASTPSNGTYAWTIPMEQPTGYDYKIKISSITNPALFDKSDHDFGIGPQIDHNRQVQNVVVGRDESICNDAKDTITVAGNSTFFTVQNGGSATFIAGLQINFLPGTRVYEGGYMLGQITETGQYCASKSPTVPAAPAMPTGGNEVKLGADLYDFRVYPNPTADRFTLENMGKELTGKVSVEIYSMKGDKIMGEELTGERRHEFSLNGKLAGIYLVRIISDGTSKTIRIIKQ